MLRNAAGLPQGDRRRPDGILSGLWLQDGTALRTGSNSGYQAINLAILAGAQRVLLLGYDMQFDPGQKSHWHGGHPHKEGEGVYLSYTAVFNTLAKVSPVPIINCSLRTGIKAFPRARMQDVLP